VVVAVIIPVMITFLFAAFNQCFHRNTSVYKNDQYAVVYLLLMMTWYSYDLGYLSDRY